MSMKPFFILLGLLLWSGSSAQAQVPALKTVYADYFPIGVAVHPRMMDPGAEAELIKTHFNSLTAENVMKMGPIQPEEGKFAWENADKILAFAQANQLKLRGHTLCWHQQTPKWFFTKNGQEVSKEELLQRLKTHIFAVVGRYKGQIYAWDVVNEAVSDTGSTLFRDSPFYKIVGEEYIEKAFEYAHQADPDALLFYNDYSTENPAKREKIYLLLQRLLAKKVPIHGMGLQGHYSLKNPSAAALEESITRFAALGLKIQVTELDVSIYDWEEKQQKVMTQELANQQAQHYKMLFEVFRKHRDKLTGVTFWNLSDKSSWLDNFPIRGRKNYPLLFDETGKPKPAFWEVVKF
jgi:endo-1,4-beta-xylanase